MGLLWERHLSQVETVAILVEPLTISRRRAAGLLNAFRYLSRRRMPVAASATRGRHPAAMANWQKDQASLEAQAAAKLQQASDLEWDTSGSWRCRARRERSAQQLRHTASDHQRAASRLAGLDLSKTCRSSVWPDSVARRPIKPSATEAKL